MGPIILLALLGFMLIIAEILLIPGIFITGVLGIAALVASCFLGFEIYGMTGGYIVIAVNTIIAAICVVYSLRSKTWKRFSLNTEIDSKADALPKEKGINVGSTGITITRLNPMGNVLFGENTVEATALGGIIDSQQEVEVIRIEDNKIFVKIK